MLFCKNQNMNDIKIYLSAYEVNGFISAILIPFWNIKQYRDFRGIHVCGIVYHICGIVYHICGIFDPQMWYSIPHMWYTQNFYFWILTMIPVPKIQKEFFEISNGNFKKILLDSYSLNDFWILGIGIIVKIQK